MSAFARPSDHPRRPYRDHVVRSVALARAYCGRDVTHWQLQIPGTTGIEDPRCCKTCRRSYEKERRGRTP